MADLSVFADKHAISACLLSRTFKLVTNLPKPHADYVADLSVFADKHALLSAAGDGTLAVIDLRKNKV